MVALLGVAGCQAGSEANSAAEAEGPAPARSGVEAPAPSPVDTAEAPLGSLPPATAEPRFVGRWAASAELCGDKPWHFSATDLATPAGSVCRFEEIKKVPGGYDIDARCTAEGPETEDELTLRFAESARAMLFESESIADAGLTYCGG